MLQKIKKIKQILSILSFDIRYAISFLKQYDTDQEIILSKLRTNAHILDKGINVVPFERGHGLTAYNKCLRLKQAITNKTILEDNSYKWACSVIDEYERKQRNDSIQIEKIRLNKLYSEDEKRIFYNIIKSRTTCRDYLDKEIDNKIWDEIINIAADAPSGYCRQPSRYYIENNHLRILNLIKCIAGATGFSSKIPYLICVTTDIRAYEIKDRLLPLIDTSLSIENFLLACSANNICTTPLNWQHATSRDDKTVREILKIPEYEKIVLFIAAGYPNSIPQKPKRLDLRWIRKR